MLTLYGDFQQIELFCMLTGCVDIIYNFGCCILCFLSSRLSELSTVVNKEHNLSTNLDYKGIIT